MRRRTNREVAIAKSSPSVDIVIVNWNTGDRLRTCLASFAAARNPAFVLGQVIVVDNASSDGSADGLDKYDLPLTLIRNKKNHGFSVACNRAAAVSRSDYLLFLNPDTRLLEDSICVPVEFLET